MEITTRLLLLSGQTLPRAGLLFDIPNRFPFVDRVGEHDGPPQLLQYIQGPVDLLSSSIVGTETVASKQGTATVTVSAGKLSVGSGTLWSFVLSNGSQYEFGSGGWVWDVSGNDRPLSVPVAACVDGREFGSNWPDTVGWSESNGEFAVGVNEPEGVGEYITNGVLVPALADKSGCCAYLSDTSLVSVMDSSPSAFFNGLDFRLATYTGGPTYVPDHLGVLRTPGANKPACQGFRLDGTDYLNTDESGNKILPSTPQRTVTYNTDWTAKTFAETFAKFNTSDPLKAPGWLCEPPRTNKVTCRKVNPVDTTNLTKEGDPSLVLSAVNFAVGIATAGLSDVCTNGVLYKADNTAGSGVSTVLIAGYTANTNTHTGSVYASGGGGLSGLRINGTVGVETLINSAELQRYTTTVVPTSTTRPLRIDIGSGRIVYFILPKLEEGSFATSPICKASDGSDPLTALTRAATVASFPTAGKIPSNNFAIRMIVVPRATGQSSVYCFGSYVDSSNYTAIIVNPTSITVRKRVLGLNTDAMVSIVHANGVPLDLILYSSSTSGMQIAVRSFSSSWGAFTDGTVNDTAAAKANAPIADTYRLGDLNGSQFTGNISLFTCKPIPAGTTDPMTWAKENLV